MESTFVVNSNLVVFEVANYDMLSMDKLVDCRVFKVGV